MPVEISVPFTLDAHGKVAVTYDQDHQSEQHVASLVSTNPGERVMLPDYGVPLKSYLFDPGSNFVDSLIVIDVRAQMAQWEPSLTVTAVTPIPDNDSGVAAVDVIWENTPRLLAATQDAVVHIGGTVVNQ